MTIAMSLEIHFHRQDAASVLIESGCSQGEEEAAESLLLALFSVRTIANLGRGPGAESLGAVLSGITSGEILKVLAGHRPADGAELIAYEGARGRKGFSARLNGSDDRIGFKMKNWGFGAMGRGVGYYAPTSVVVLLQALTRRREGDDLYVTALARTAEAIGDLALAGAITVRSQVSCAKAAVDEAALTLAEGPDLSTYERIPLPEADPETVVPRPVALFAGAYDELLRYYRITRRKQPPDQAFAGAVRRTFSGGELKDVTSFLEGRQDATYGGGAGADLVAMTIENFENLIRSADKFEAE